MHVKKDLTLAPLIESLLEEDLPAGNCDPLQRKIAAEKNASQKSDVGTESDQIQDRFSLLD